MIVRVELDNLIQKGEYYFLNNILFTGEAYDHRDNKLYKVYEINQGIISSDRDYGFLGEKGMLKLDYSLLMSEEDFDVGEYRLYFQGKPFTGVYYEYRFGFVLCESLSINGWTTESIGFLPDGTGRMKSYERNQIDHTGTTKDRKYYLDCKDNYLNIINSEYYDYKSGEQGKLSFHFNKQKKIDQASVKTYNEELELLVPRDDLGLDFKTYSELLMKKNIIAKDISILEIGDELLNQWLDMGILDNVECLELFYTGVTHLTVSRLVRLTSLKKLTCIEPTLFQSDISIANKQKQRYKALAIALFSLKQSNAIDVSFTDNRIDFFNEYLPNSIS